MDIGEKIRNLRRSAKMTQEDLGNKYDLNKATISGYENNSRKPDYNFLISLADDFEVSLDWLLGRTEKPIVYFKSDIEKMMEGMTEKEKQEIYQYVQFIKIKSHLDTNPKSTV